MNYKYALIQIVKTYKKHSVPAIAVTVILAVGMAVNITVFMTINTALFRPLPVTDPHNLLSLYDYNVKNKTRPFRHISYPDYSDLAEYGSSFNGLLAYAPSPLKLKIGNGRAQSVVGEFVSDNYFDVLGVQPVIGRTFTGKTEAGENYSPVVISHHFWKNKLASDPNISGAVLEIDEKSFTVIGVMPPEFFGLFLPGFSPQLWVPFSSIRDNERIAFNTREAGSLLVVGRLRNNVTLSQAQAEMDSGSQWLEKAYPSERENSRNYRLFSTNDIRIAADPSALPIMRGVSLLLQALFVTVLLIIVLNVAALFSAWGLSRKNEIAVITALGCSRRRMICQLLIESITISVIGGISGLCIAGVMAGLLPAIRSANAEPAILLTESNRKTTSELKVNRLHRIIIPQIGISMLLLIPAGLLCGSFMKIRNAYRTSYVEQSAAVTVDFDFNKYSSEKKDKFLSALAPAINNMRGVGSVCLANSFPLSGVPFSFIMIDDNNEKQWGGAACLYVSNGCFETFDAGLLHGRIFDERDIFPNSNAVIITESFAKKHWKTSNPLNKHIIIEETRESRKIFTVTGIVKDVQANPLKNKSSEYIFLPFSQNNSNNISVVGRGRSPASVISDRLRRMIYEIDDNIIISDGFTMRQYAERQTYMIKALIAVFAILGFSGLLLMCIGTYGLISYSIAQKKREIGIQIAVGAQNKDIIMMLLGEGCRMLVIGLSAGNIGVVLIIQIVSKLPAAGFIYNFIPLISIWNPLVFIGISTFMASVIMFACCIPALKIIFKDPMTLIKQI